MGCPYLYLSHHQRSCLFIIVCSMKFFESTVFYSTVLWRCWLGGRKGILPVKKMPVKKNARWDAGVVICLERGADLHTVQLMPLPLTVSCFSKIQSKLVLPFWYQLTWVVPDKGPLNGCVCVCTVFCSTALFKVNKCTCTLCPNKTLTFFDRC